MTPYQKRIGLLFLAGSLISLVLLAASLPNLELQPGRALPNSRNVSAAAPLDTTSSPVQTYSFPILRGVFALVFLILVIYLPARLAVFISVKRILGVALALAGLLLITYLLPRIAPGQVPTFPGDSAALVTPSPIGPPVTPLGPPPQALIWVVIGVILFGLGTLAVTLWKRWPSTANVEDRLLQEAESALSAIQARADLKNVILRCYAQMTQLLQEEQEIVRYHSMTVQEFEGVLISRGFPPAPVGQLTGLFEKARYGGQQMSAEDEAVARASLNEIIQFCRSGEGVTRAQP
jgi:hypothetical protein